MRETKFRVYYKPKAKGKKWEEVEPGIYRVAQLVWEDWVNQDFLFKSLIIKIVRDEKTGNQLGCTTKEVELMQFTGLKDKNGTEIYEGDIIKSLYPAGYTLYEVKLGFYDNDESYEDNVCGNGWYLKGKSFYHENNGAPSTGFEIHHFTLDNYPLDAWPWELVGNIYENPELLKQKG